MNKINPLYILIFFILVLLLMIVQNITMQNKIMEASQQISIIKKVGQEISSLKEHWKNPTQAKKNIDALLNNRTFKKSVTKQEKKSNLYKIALKDLNAVTLDKFMSKILNEYVVIKKISIDRVAEDKISIAMEIEL
ncbi:MAG: hypothetical protein U9P71_06340 [Campylobacterota bacterium]|nr:hypothetical protein [Campylobacterota bacterium]